MRSDRSVVSMVGTCFFELSDAFDSSKKHVATMQRQVGRQHGRHMLLRTVERVRNVGLAVLGLPLLGAGRALGQLPLVLEQVLEEVVAPAGRRLRPGHLWTARDRIGADAGA